MDFKFSSKVAEQFFLANRRILLWISGYNSGKSWTAIQKGVFLALAFPGYRIGVFRSNATDLKRTTRQTFYKVIGEDFIARDIDGQVPETDLTNGSKIYWLHVDIHTVDSIKSLEINMAIYDQAEDLAESVFDAIDSRVGRWENVEIPKEYEHLLTRNQFTGKLEPPAYFILLANPPEEGEISWLYQTLEPKDTENPEIKKDTYSTIKIGNRVAFFESSSVLNQAINQENLSTLLSRDKAFVERYVHGRRSQGEGAIHYVNDESILNYDEEFVEKLIKKASLVRVMDYGASSPTCVTWWAVLGGNYICYREYYVPDKVISYHRKSIAELSGDEYYGGNYADPSIFKRDQEKKGGRSSIAIEFADPDIYCDKPGDAPPINFAPADNNEFATRNRINEMLNLTQRNKHPVTGLTSETGFPSLYFIKQSAAYPDGCYHIIRETKAQKKTLLDTINGKPYYSDDRDDTVVDHAYDTLRYFVSIHQRPGVVIPTKPHYMSFNQVIKRLKARKMYEDTYIS